MLNRVNDVKKMKQIHKAILNEADNLNSLPVLDEVREIFYKNTGLIISFHYPGISNIDFYPSFEKSNFCKLVQSNSLGMKRCFESDRNGLKEARFKGGYNIYRCHAGLTDVVIPLNYKGQELGAIYTGQLSIEPLSEEHFDEIFTSLKGIGIDRGKLRTAYYDIKYVDIQTLKKNVRFLSLIANYIISVENELVLQKEIVRKNQLLHQKEKEKLKLEKALKDLTISVLDFKKLKQEKNNITESSIKTHEHIVLKAQLFIKSNYENSITLEDVASAVYLSPSYFSTIFKETSGYNFSSYLTKMRIEAAREMLEKTAVPIKEIVYKVGFEDYNYFNRVFKSYNNVPPGEYRRKYRDSSIVKN